MAMEYKAEDIVRLIRARYPSGENGAGEWVVLEQVPDGTSMHQRRWIDVAAFSMWLKNGLSRVAFEVKVDRSDFLRELNNPVKHAWCQECFHLFYFVAPKGVIQVEELPPGVGWLYPRGERLCTARQAKRNPSPRLDDVLLAGFMRAAGKELNRDKAAQFGAMLAAHDGYRSAQRFEKATRRFLTERGKEVYYSQDGEEEIYKALVDATMDNELLADRELFLTLTGRFQKDIAALLDLMIVLAKRAIFARNEVGQNIIGRFGGTQFQGDTIEELRKHLNDPKSRDHLKQYATFLDTLLAWDDLKETGGRK